MRAITLLLALASAACSSPALAKLDLANASVSHLPNGLTVIMLEDHSFPVVSVQMLYKSGSAAEVTGKTGLAHFLEHLAFRASANYPNAGATELIYDAGGEWHGYTAMDQTTYFATMPKDGLEQLLRIEADRMARTVIDPASIEAEKGAVITELHSYENDPAGVLQDAVVRTALQSHPYGSPMAGYVSDVERLTIDDARAYYTSHYVPENAVLAIAGDIDPTMAKASVERAFAVVAARPTAEHHYTTEVPQRGERRIRLLGPTDRQYFQMAYTAPAASSPDFPAFLILQQILTGSPGLNPRQSGWSGSAAAKGSLLYGATGDIASWLPATQDPFLFMVSGSLDASADSAELERGIASRIANLRDSRIPDARLKAAKLALARILEEDVLTTEDAAHQLAFFEGVGALDTLLGMPQLVERVTAAELQRVAQTYLSSEKRTVGWMVPGRPSGESIGVGNLRSAAHRSAVRSASSPAEGPELRRLPGSLPIILQKSQLSDTVTVELLLPRPVSGETVSSDLVGLGTVTRSGRPADLERLVTEVAAASESAKAKVEGKSEDPQTRLQQLLNAQMGKSAPAPDAPLGIVVSGNIDADQVIAMLERRFGRTAPGKVAAIAAPNERPDIVRDRIDKPLSQGAIGYVVGAPPGGTREFLAWRMLLYVLTHDYSGRLGRSAIGDKGLVYHIYSSLRTNGRQSWATISTGVDPNKADAMEAELRAQIAKLAADPPTIAETNAARAHILGRDISAAQSNDELAAKLTREFVETGGLRAHAQLLAQLEAITPADLSSAARHFVRGTIVRVDVGGQPSPK